MVQKIQFKTIIRIQLAIFILALFLSIGCYQKNTDADFYSFEDANTKLISAYESKDVICNTNRRLIAFVPGRSRKKDIDLCVSAVLAVSCESWASTSIDATPTTCKSIEFRY
ncbi:LIC13255 family lipoprotein [Leptospira interrogans]|uniref:LIC13255 family lipoprotein n=1 Tax=Leptospira interrogans TaxID=173 RepID=UPI0007735164|nr:hypothetical protein [Leptospira interrogans]